MPAPLAITQQSFSSTVMDASTPVLVDFWAQWCGPCKALAPVIDEIANEYDGKVVVGKVDIDAERALAATYRIMSIPTLMIFKDGKKVKEFIGARPKAEITAALDELI